MYRLAPFAGRLRTRFRRQLGLPYGLAEAATRSWVISPAVERLAPPAIFDPADLEKIVGVGPDDTVEGQIAKVKGGMQRHDATIAYQLDNAVLSHGHLFTRKLAVGLDISPLPLIAHGAAQFLDEAVLATSHYGIKYFGHWMADDLPRLLAASEIGHPVSTLLRPTPHQLDYLQLLGLKAEVMTSAYFRKIVVLEDYAQNDYKRQRYLELRDRAGGARAARQDKRVMLLRGNSGNRRVLLNESEVADAVRRRGFNVISPAECTVSEIIEACHDASIVIGVEGSQLANGHMWMSTQGTLVVLEQPNRFTAVHKDPCDCAGIRFAFIVGDGRNETDFSIDVSRLERLLDRTERETQ